MYAEISPAIGTPGWSSNVGDWTTEGLQISIPTLSPGNYTLSFWAKVLGPLNTSNVIFTNLGNIPSTIQFGLSDVPISGGTYVFTSSQNVPTNIPTTAFTNNLAFTINPVPNPIAPSPLDNNWQFCSTTFTITSPNLNTLFFYNVIAQH